MTSVLQFISNQAVGIAIALCMASAIVVGQRIDAPTETDALQASAEISNDLAAQHAVVASKD